MAYIHGKCVTNRYRRERPLMMQRVRDRSVSHGYGRVSQRHRSVSHGYGGSGVRERLLVDHGVETVDRVGGVLYGAPGAVRLHQRVPALDDVAVAALLLVLDVAGYGVLGKSFI